jgi:hypothetical protein
MKTTNNTTQKSEMTTQPINQFICDAESWESCSIRNIDTLIFKRFASTEEQGLYKQILERYNQLKTFIIVSTSNKAYVKDSELEELRKFKSNDLKIVLIQYTKDKVEVNSTMEIQSFGNSAARIIIGDIVAVNILDFSFRWSHKYLNELVCKVDSDLFVSVLLKMFLRSIQDHGNTEYMSEFFKSVVMNAPTVKINDLPLHYFTRESTSPLFECLMSRKPTISRFVADDLCEWDTKTMYYNASKDQRKELFEKLFCYQDCFDFNPFDLDVGAVNVAVKKHYPMNDLISIMRDGFGQNLILAIFREWDRQRIRNQDDLDISLDAIEQLLELVIDRPMTYGPVLFNSDIVQNDGPWWDSFERARKSWLEVIMIFTLDDHRNTLRNMKKVWGCKVDQLFDILLAGSEDAAVKMWKQYIHNMSNAKKLESTARAIEQMEQPAKKQRQESVLGKRVHDQNE